MVDAMYSGLTVTGPNEEIARFREAVRGRDQHGGELALDFNRVIPIPSEITNPFTPEIQIDNHHVQYSPSWCGSNWGASSNALSTEILEENDGTFWIQFDVAGDFPDQILEKMAAAFPELVFEGSAFENVSEFYMTFEGRNGQFSWQEGDYKEAFGEDEFDDDDSDTPEIGPDAIEIAQ